MMRTLPLVLLFTAGLSFVAAAPPPELVQLQQQYAFVVAERVASPYDKGLEALNAKFLTALGNAGEEARKAGKLPDVLAIIADKDLITNGQDLPVEDDETTPAALKKLRSVYRGELAKLAQQRLAAQSSLLAAYSANLQALESTLTKANRVEEAKEVMQYRTGLGATAPPATTGTTATPVTRGKDYTNSLGMKFVKVLGTGVLFCIHETRRQDYAAFAKEVPGMDEAWKNQQPGGVPSGGQDDHPVVAVSWDDAQAFCQWLSKKEGRRYRLPTDKEWSFAVGVGDSEVWAADVTPKSRSLDPKEHFPWGESYPPTKNNQDGNYADMVFKEKFPSGSFIAGYSDGFATTSPVMTFKPNKSGLYDLGGNVWEWCEDWHDGEKGDRLLRGASWNNFVSTHMASSFRSSKPPNARVSHQGFRVVLEEGVP